MNIIVSTLFLFQRGTGPTTMEDVPAGLNAWLFTHVVLPILGFVGIIMIWSHYSEKANKKKKKQKENLKENLKEIKELENQISESKIAIHKHFHYMHQKQELALNDRILKGKIRSSDIELKDGLYYFKLSKNVVTGKVERYHNELSANLEFKFSIIGKSVEEMNEYAKRADKKAYSGQLSSIKEFKNGKQNGVSKGWYENGQLEYVFEFKEGKFNGVNKSWHENGQLKSEHNYVENMFHGSFRDWYKNGQLESETFYVKDKLHGTDKHWHENGQLDYEEQYVDDKKLIKK